MKLKSLCSLYNHEFKYSLSIELVEFRLITFFLLYVLEQKLSSSE